MRRLCVRLLRLRNIVIFTFIVILLYMIRTGTEVKSIADVARPVQDSLYKILSNDKTYFVPASLKKIDWHNYSLIEYERQRVGIGEHGHPAHLPTSDSVLETDLYSVNGFNGALSDRIPLNRSLPDIRHIGCQKRLYIESLPTVSVVVPFHNEHWSTLLRTAYSVLNRSPSFLIKEIFLVDDASTKTFLKGKLDEYVAKHLPKVRVLRLASRSGLITARLAGARRATADVLIFLDSHTEANVNWLPPLLEPIALNYRTVVCPFIDVVAYDTFEYRAQDEGARGAFDWELFYKRLPVLPRDETNMPEPFESPVMAGGLFAISRVFFWELGGYDPGLDIWGGEQYELSFKIWQCGGRMVDAPCSRVGHIYRKFAPFPNPGHGDFVGRNYRRVAEVWMDEYASFLYKRRPHYLRIHPGDISRQRALRERLKCKPFRWFMTQVAFDLTAKYPPVEPNPFASGQVRPATHPQYCVDAHHGQQMDKLQLKHCTSAAAGEQEFILSWHKDIKCKNRNMCWDVPDTSPKSPILLYGCHLGGGNQLWRYHPVAFDLTAKYPPVEPNPFASGQVRPATHPQYCVDAHHGQQMDKLQLKHCTSAAAGEQEFILSWHKDIKCKNRNMCWDVPDTSPKSPILLYGCHLGGGNQLWRYHPNTQRLKHSNNDNCLDWNPSTRELFINPCSETSNTQEWLIDSADNEMMDMWEKVAKRVTGPIED